MSMIHVCSPHDWVRETSKLKIHLCVCGGIVAYKTVDLVSALQKGHTVRVAMSQSAQSFVGPLTFQGLTVMRSLPPCLSLHKSRALDILILPRRLILSSLPRNSEHVGESALGIGDDLISTILVAANLPLVFVPAMNTEMWLNPYHRSCCHTASVAMSC